MIAGMMIYVPAIANFRMNRLNDRLAAANTAALVLDAAPSGMVPDSLAREILKSIGARAVAIKMGQRLIQGDCYCGPGAVIQTVAGIGLARRWAR